MTYFSKTDAFLEIPRSRKEKGRDQKPQRLALALDSTSDRREQVLADKLTINTKKIVGVGEKKPSVKYFESKIEKVKRPDGTKVPFRGKLDFILPVVIGLDSSHANNIMSLYARFLKLEQLQKRTPDQVKTRAELIREISNHPAQVIFLRQISEQLSMYISILEKSDHSEKDNLIPQILQLQKTFEDIQGDKIKIDPTPIEKDPVYLAIKKVAQNMTPEKIGLTTITTSP